MRVPKGRRVMDTNFVLKELQANDLLILRKLLYLIWRDYSLAEEVVTK